MLQFHRMLSLVFVVVFYISIQSTRAANITRPNDWQSEHKCQNIDAMSVTYDVGCSNVDGRSGCNAGNQGLNCRFCGFATYAPCPDNIGDLESAEDLFENILNFIERDIAIVNETPDEFYSRIYVQNRPVMQFQKDDPSNGSNSIQLANGATLNRRMLWSNGVVPYLITNRFSEHERDIILKAISVLEKHSCIKFEQRTTEVDYIHIFRGSGCFSLVGRFGGGQPLSIGYSCMYVGTVMHELMHALGLFHEQSRADRDDYLNIHMENVIPGFEKNFQKYSLGQIDHLGEPYDLASLMHYNNFEFSKNGNETIVAKNGFELQHSRFKTSPTEIDSRKINKLYGCRPDYQVTTPAPTETTLGTTAITPVEECHDINSNCEGWAKYGLCGSNERYMKLACQLSCNACVSDNTKCQNNDDACVNWAATGQCSLTVEYMRVVCPLACGYCVA